jgi:small subunit ribosomal protein S6
MRPDGTLARLPATPVTPYNPKRRQRGGADSVHGKTYQEVDSGVNEYEILLMLDPELDEERGNEIIARIRERVEGDKGKWDGHEPWGRRKLAYEIDHKPDGVYHLLLFTASPETLAEISRVLKITDGVMRHLAVRRVKGGHTKAPAPAAAVSAPADDADGTAE